MDISSLLNKVLSADSVKNMSKTTKTSAKDVQNVLTTALPSLLNGALLQSKNSATAESFAKALTQHSAKDTSDLGSFLKNVDLADGAKIVGHLLGSDSADVVSKASKKSGVSEEKTSSILAAAAPLLMSLLGQETKSKRSADDGLDIGDIIGSIVQNVDVGDLLSGLLGGSDSKSTKKTAKKSTSKKKSTSSKKKTAASDKAGGVLGSLLKLLK